MAVRALLLTDSALVALLNKIPNSAPADPAIYVQHVANVEEVLYPAISLFTVGGTDGAIRCVEHLTLQVDIWTPGGGDPTLLSGMASELEGADRLYRLHVKPLLHMAHQRAALNTSAFYVPFCSEIPHSVEEMYERPQRLHHIAARYDVRIQPVAADLQYSNG